jgi:hypothetical protein
MSVTTPLRLKDLVPAEVVRCLARRPTLIVPVGSTEQHGAHLPLGIDTILVERLADDLSATPSSSNGSPTIFPPASGSCGRRRWSTPPTAIRTGPCPAARRSGGRPCTG